MTIFDRIKTIADKKQIAISRIEKDCGLGNATIKKWTTSTPSVDNLQKVAVYLKVNPDYLLGRTDSPNPEDKLIHPANEYFASHVITMPIIGSICAGYNGEAVEEILGETTILPMSMHGYTPEECFLLQVKGDSMYPDFHDKDIVLVHRQDSVDSGSVAVVMYNGDEATLKKVIYKQHEDWMELIPRNPEYTTKRIAGTELLDCRVLGKVISLVHREIL